VLWTLLAAVSLSRSEKWVAGAPGTHALLSSCHFSIFDDPERHTRQQNRVAQQQQQDDETISVEQKHQNNRIINHHS
jgi:hypothetical protein